MQITLTQEHEEFVSAQVRTGRFATPEQVVAEALSRLMQDPAEELDDESYAALQRGDAQLARGEGRELADARAELRAKYRPR